MFPSVSTGTLGARAALVAFLLTAACNALVGIDAPRSKDDASSSTEAGGGRVDDAGSSTDETSSADTTGAPDGAEAAGPTGILTRVSVSSAGAEGNSASGDDGAGVSVSGDGRLVAFSSRATNLVDFDSNLKRDVFVHDRASGMTTRVSLAGDGSEPNADCIEPVFTADGTRVVFASTASNLATSATNGSRQLFVRALASAGVEHRSRGAGDPITFAAVSGDGAVLAFGAGYPAGVYAAFGEPLQLARIDVGMHGRTSDCASEEPSVSGDGNWIAFSSCASNLVQADVNEQNDVFVVGLHDASMQLVSVSTTGQQANGWSSSPAISRDGHRVAFASIATNLVAGDNNGVGDVFVRDFATNETIRVSVSSAGVEGDNTSYGPSISDDGRLVAFSSIASNLVPDDVRFPGDTNYEDVFVHDLVTHTTIRISVGMAGARANGNSNRARISGNGRVVVFLSDAPNLVAGDTNESTDAFAYEFRSAPWL